MSDRLKCYFAHSSNTWGTEEEKEILEELKFRRLIIHNPFETKIHVANIERKNNLPYKEARNIWIEDEVAIGTSDIIVAYQPHVSGGTCAEIRLAYSLHKIIYIISPIKHPLFAYILTGPNKQFETIEDWKHNRELRWD